MDIFFFHKFLYLDMIFHVLAQINKVVLCVISQYDLNLETWGIKQI